MKCICMKCIYIYIHVCVYIHMMGSGKDTNNDVR